LINVYKNQIIDANGVCFRTSDQCLESLYQGLSLDGMWLRDSDVEKYNQTIDAMDLKWQPLKTQTPQTQTDINLIKTLQNYWLIPQHYQQFDIESYVLSLCETDEEVSRVNMELESFKKMNWIPVLQTLKYIVDVMRENSVTWGVGRGSSVASYVLFLIGVHKINSIHYQLDFKEFAKTQDK